MKVICRVTVQIIYKLSGNYDYIPPSPQKQRQQSTVPITHMRGDSQLSVNSDNQDLIIKTLTVNGKK